MAKKNDDGKADMNKACRAMATILGEDYEKMSFIVLAERGHYLSTIVHVDKMRLGHIFVEAMESLSAQMKREILTEAFGKLPPVELDRLKSIIAEAEGQKEPPKKRVCASDLDEPSYVR